LLPLIFTASASMSSALFTIPPQNPDAGPVSGSP
jgi:hypothetical protein